MQIIETSISKTGKHGHAKIHMVALDIFTGKKMEDISPTSHNMTQPVVTRQDFQLLNVDDEDFCSLMNDKSESKVGSRTRAHTRLHAHSDTPTHAHMHPPVYTQTSAALPSGRLRPCCPYSRKRA